MLVLLVINCHKEIFRTIKALADRKLPNYIRWSDMIALLVPVGLYILIAQDLSAPFLEAD